LNPSEDRSYETLKSELIKRVCLSQKEKIRRLLEFEEIGDRKSSQFLHLRNLASNTVNDDFLKMIWKSRLPSYLQQHLVGQTGH